MDNYIQMLYRPVHAMWDNLFLIIPSTVIAIGITLLDTFYGLIEVEARLVMGLLILMLIDLISGIYKANCNNRATTSVGLRQTSIKFVEYTLVSFSFVILSNMTELLSFVSSMPFVFLSLIEIKSIVENLSDPKGVIRALFDHVRDAIAKRTGN